MSNREFMKTIAHACRSYFESRVDKSSAVIIAIAFKKSSAGGRGKVAAGSRSRSDRVREPELDPRRVRRRRRRGGGGARGRRRGNRLWWSSGEQTGIPILSSDSRVPTRLDKRAGSIRSILSSGRYTLTGLGLMDLLASPDVFVVEPPRSRARTIVQPTSSIDERENEREITQGTGYDSTGRSRPPRARCKTGSLIVRSRESERGFASCDCRSIRVHVSSRSRIPRCENKK